MNLRILESNGVLASPLSLYAERRHSPIQLLFHSGPRVSLGTARMVISAWISVIWEYLCDPSRHGPARGTCDCAGSCRLYTPRFSEKYNWVLEVQRLLGLEYRGFTMHVGLGTRDVSLKS